MTTCFETLNINDGTWMKVYIYRGGLFFLLTCILLVTFPTNLG